MSEANYTARANAKANILTLAANITIQCDANGLYAHDAATRFKNLFILQLGACYNDTQPGEGLRKLSDNGDNLLTVIKSTDRVTAESVLLEAKKAEATLKRQTNVDEKPHFETRAEAKVEADDRNYAKPPLARKKVPSKPSRPSSGPTSPTTSFVTPTVAQKVSTSTDLQHCSTLLPQPQNAQPKRRWLR